MTQRFTSPRPQSKNSISETAVRAVLAGAGAGAGRRRPLRRWSVAELIARAHAVAAPPTDRVRPGY